jgi:hypothetical protein
MKQYKITLTEEQWNQFEHLLGKVKLKRALPLLNMINPNLQVGEDKPKEEEPCTPLT